MTEKSIPIYICGNKVDLRTEAIQKGISCVREQDGERVAREHGATFFETSSKTGLNITNALIGITRYSMLELNNIFFFFFILVIKQCQLGTYK